MKRLILAAVLLANVGLLGLLLLAIISGFVSTTEGTVILGAFLCEGLILYYRQDEFRGPPKQGA